MASEDESEDGLRQRVAAAAADAEDDAAAAASDGEDDGIVAEPGGQWSDDEDAHDLADLQAFAERARQEHARLEEQHAKLEHAVAQFFAAKKAKSTEGDRADGREKSTAELEAEYRKVMDQIADEREVLEELRWAFDKQRRELSDRLTERQSHEEEIRSELRRYKMQVFRSAENTRTGKPLPERVIEERLALEQRREIDLGKFRLRNIMLRHQLRKLDDQLQRREELADGLHLIDFEQLKIENQSYNEKIEERNEEILKLRKKITSTVQVLSHVKEKQHYVAALNEREREERDQLERALKRERDQLSRLKQDRDRLRAENQRMQQESGLVGNDELLWDYELLKGSLERVQVRLEELQSEHVEMTEEMRAVRRRTRALEEHVAAAARRVRRPY